jgi:RND family efflux transporter MFP subunit
VISAAARYLAPLCGLLGLVGIAFAAGGDAGPSVQVQAVPLRQQPLEETVTGFGTAATSEESTADISFPHAGQITALTVRVGEKVTRGRELASVTADPATLLGYQKSVAAVDFAKRDLARVKTLLAQHLATNTQVAAAQKIVSDATAELEAQRKLGNDQQVRIATAPFDGFVAKLMVAPGDRLQANTAIMQLARTDRGVRIITGLKPEDAARVAPGMVARVVPVQGGNAQPIEGTVRQVSGSLNATTRLIDTLIDVAKSADQVLPGTSAAVTVIISRHTGWVVPRNAVLHADKGSYLFQVADGHARRVEVKTGIETDALTEVSGSFDPGLAVVTVGNYELRDGMAVRDASTGQ